MHSYFLQSLPNDSSSTDSFVYQAKKKRGKASGNEKYPNTRYTYLLLSLRFFREGQHLGFYECFLSTLFSVPLVWQNGVKEENRKLIFFLITFWNLRVVVIKT